MHTMDGAWIILVEMSLALSGLDVIETGPADDEATSDCMQAADPPMSASRRREFACAILIDTFDRFLLQQRDDVPGVFQRGKIGLFGGHREGDETYLQCIVREIHEEVSFFLPPENFIHLASYDGDDIDVAGGTVRGEFFVARGVPVERLIITEGSLLIVKPNELFLVEHRLSPSGKFGMKAFLECRDALAWPLANRGRRS
jgi:8-oxo-dGTP diphosphatase